MTTHNALSIQDYTFVTKERVRYRDTDAHGHVNNSVFLTYLEIGRVAMLMDSHTPLIDKDCQYVVARQTIDFLREIRCPGEVEIGVRLQSVGRSSCVLEQAIFQQGDCAAKAEVVMVQTNKEVRKSQPFSQALRERLLAAVRMIRH